MPTRRRRRRMQPAGLLNFVHDCGRIFRQSVNVCAQSHDVRAQLTVLSRHVTVRVGVTSLHAEFDAKTQARVVYM